MAHSQTLPPGQTCRMCQADTIAKEFFAASVLREKIMPSQPLSPKLALSSP